MPLNTVALGVALTPTVVSTLVSHYLHRKSLHHKPNVHISYDESISIIREFITYSSKRPLEYIQEFTAQRVPAPHWVKTQHVTIPEECLTSAATAIHEELGPHGIARVGGQEWWQWRGPSGDLKGEWIEMKNDYNERKHTSRDHPSQKRIMLYIHGGAYYFGSVETHRYQLQRHARKLKGRVFARGSNEDITNAMIAEYRLAPQFPFPCGLQDSLAAYLYLLKDHAPSEILFAGDSAGGGMVLSMLVICREQGLPLPAGAILISPWVDLTHSFPSVAKENPGDYIPPHGFIHKPSAAWPPPNDDDMLEIKKSLQKDSSVELQPNTLEVDASQPAMGHHRPPPSIVMNGKTIEVKDQIHMYTTNDLLFHPLVSPIFQPSLGGLCPLQIVSGGGEMLRDEQFYIAHKAANPTSYPPSDDFLDEFDPKRLLLHKYPGTYVQLQVWDDLCHVAPALSFTRPAKFMFRSIAQFGAWALACAQDSKIEILTDDEISPILSSDSDSPHPSIHGDNGTEGQNVPVSSVGRAGDTLPAFKDRMIRQRVGKRGYIYPLEPPSSYSVLRIPSESVGTINPTLLMKWILAKEELDHRFAKEKARVQQQLIKELAYGFQEFDGETPPPSSLAARRSAPGVLPPKALHKSYPMFMWSRLASRHDKKTIKREHQKEGQSCRTSVEAGRAGASTKENEPTNEHASSLLVHEQNGIILAEPEPTALDTEKSNYVTPNDNPSGSTPGIAAYLSDKPLSPLIVLPDYESRHTDEVENASTRALFHAQGTIHSRSTSDLRNLQRPPSRAGSATIRSGFTSDPADDVSITGDEHSLAVTGAGVETASTQAVVHATGVVGIISDASRLRQSVDSLTVTPYRIGSESIKNIQQ
ncbi:hypothetical protein P175DRAFT_0533038 [Aspergillus ochraceoroseus IBT 24754]|uniref:Alpha/beta hydrolase fold-3 domain-containing protein n=2 Tax=Aspergillus ochraceoroseus TaxID=138278 RepID=A0A2T5LUV7_9EURO|nr:uncharacterized protein P175DRAFT_0533038 [Aspergillus ochraceoroseus IBT 24754]KKK14490.1 hypothetical protein AOCH_002466 [Aspergillus ochraceoroseus]PTU20064.1 hypothetical protein P175DRAFT_0533038 [Aspergillus ochraceoroseus IBT 24754]